MITTDLFTFQYVSINTRPSIHWKHPAKCFTFQYVSINTHNMKLRTWQELSLHSNMFLLIRL